jgi:hypothetical protein
MAQSLAIGNYNNLGLKFNFLIFTMATYGAAPRPDGSAFLRPVNALMTPQELMNPSSSLLDFVHIRSLVVGDCLPIIEFRLPVIGVDPDDLTPQTWDNVLFFAAICTVTPSSANSNFVHFLLTFNAYGTGGTNPAECLLRHPLPVSFTLRHDSDVVLPVLSEEAIRDLGSNVGYNAFFTAMNAALLLVHTAQSRQAIVVPAIGGVAALPAALTGTVKANDASFLYKTGDSIFTTASVSQTEQTEKIRAIYGINSCDIAIALSLSGGSKNITSEKSVSQFRRNIPPHLQHLIVFLPGNFEQFLQMIGVPILYMTGTKANGMHLALWIDKNSDGSIFVFTKIEELQTAWMNFFLSVVTILTPNTPADIQFFNAMIAPFYSLFTARGMDTMSTVEINGQVHFFNNIFVEFCDQFKNPLYIPANPPQTTIDLFETVTRGLFTVSAASLQLACNKYKNNPSEILLQYPINLKPQVYADSQAVKGPSPSAELTPAAAKKKAANKKKLEAKTKSVKDLQAFKKQNTGAAPIVPVVNNQTSAVITRGFNSTYCVNHFGSLLPGMPPDAKATGCHPSPGRTACTRIHLAPPAIGTKLSQTIADDLIGGVQSFTNPSFKSNFLRIVRSLV